MQPVYVYEGACSVVSWFLIQSTTASTAAVRVSS
jgi:hypothetical protein